MSKRAEKIAGRIADRLLKKSGSVSKSYGSRQGVIDMMTPVCECIAILDQGLKRRDKQLAAMSSHLDAMSARWGQAGGLAEFIPGEFEIRRRADSLIQRQMQNVNGTADASPVPGWHPEINLQGVCGRDRDHQAQEAPDARRAGHPAA